MAPKDMSEDELEDALREALLKKEEAEEAKRRKNEQDAEDIWKGDK